MCLYVYCCMSDQQAMRGEKAEERPLFDLSDLPCVVGCMRPVNGKCTGRPQFNPGVSQPISSARPVRNQCHLHHTALAPCPATRLPLCPCTERVTFRVAA